METYIIDNIGRDRRCSEAGQYADADSDALRSELQKALHWLRENVNATKLQCVEKMAELQAKGGPAADSAELETTFILTPK